MKAITVQQPWASLIAHGLKTIETRPAPPNGPMRPEGVRGLPGASIERGERIAIHAGASTWGIDSPRAEMVRRLPRQSYSALRDAIGSDVEECLPPYTRYPLGAVVATAVVSDALRVFPSWEANNAWTRRHLPRGRSLAKSITVMEPILIADLTAPQVAIDQHGSTYCAPEAALGDFSEGRWGWLLTDVRRIDPVPCKGRQGVWDLGYDLSEKVAIAEAVR